MKATTTKKSTARASKSAAAETDNTDTPTLQETQGTQQAQDPAGASEPSQLEKLYTDMLKGMYGAERQLIEGLKAMVEAATTDVLKDALEDHMFLTHKHAARLEKIFKLMGMTAEDKPCLVMDALIKEGQEMIAATQEGSMTRDAALIIAAQKVEHYEIASYGSLVQVALTLGHSQAAAILEKTLWEEEDTDSTLTVIAESEINPMADDEKDEEGANTYAMSGESAEEEEEEDEE